MTVATRKYYSEFRTFEIQNFVEAEERDGKKVSTFSGVHQVAGIENNNGRVYPLKLFENLLKSPEFASKLKYRQLVGMLGHPPDGIVSPVDISHVTVEMKILYDQKLEDGGVPIWCKSEILDTPAGDVLKRLFRSGIRLGTSSRGWGDSHQEGQTEILDENFDLGGFDMVVEPSVDAAFPVASLAENYNRFARLVQERLDRFEEQDDAPVTERELEAYQTILDSVCESSPCRIDDSKVQGQLSSLRERVKHSLASPPETVDVNPQLDAGEQHMERTAEGAKLEQIHESVVKTQTTLQEENARLRRDLTHSRQQSAALNEKLENAHTLISRMTERLRGESKHADAAKRLAEAAIDSATDSRKAVLTERRRVNAAAQVVEASLKKAAASHEDNLGEHVASLVQKFPPEKREAAARALQGAKSFAEANGLYRSLIAIGGSKTETRQRDSAVLEALKRTRKAPRNAIRMEAKRRSGKTGNDIVDRARALVEHFSSKGEARVNG